MVVEIEIGAQGQLMRIARIDSDKYEFLDYPKPSIARLPACGIRLDLFALMQRKAHREPRHPCPGAV